MGRFYRHVLIEKNYPHHGAVAFGHFGKALYEVFKYIGVPLEDINYNQPKGVRYPTENRCIRYQNIFRIVRVAQHGSNSIKKNIAGSYV